MKPDATTFRLHWIMAIILVCTSAASIVADGMFRKQLINGQTFLLQFQQNATACTNAGDSGLFRDQIGTNSSGNVTFMGIPVTNYDYTAIGLIISTNHPGSTPFWTNHAAFDNLYLGVPEGFEFFDATSARDGIWLCYKESVSTYVEHIVMATNIAMVVSRSRQMICKDDISAGQHITRAAFLPANNLPVRLVATGILSVNEINWNLHEDRWLLQTTTTNASDMVSVARRTSQYWLWKDGHWIERQ